MTNKKKVLLLTLCCYQATRRCLAGHTISSYNVSPLLFLQIWLPLAVNILNLWYLPKWILEQVNNSIVVQWLYLDVVSKLMKKIWLLLQLPIDLKLKLTLSYNNLINKKSICPTNCIGSKKSLIARPPTNQI